VLWQRLIELDRGNNHLGEKSEEKVTSPMYWNKVALYRCTSSKNRDAENLPLHKGSNTIQQKGLNALPKSALAAAEQR